jgi:hypothetical protein
MIGLDICGSVDASKEVERRWNESSFATRKVDFKSMHRTIMVAAHPLAHWLLAIRTVRNIALAVKQADEPNHESSDLADQLFDVIDSDHSGFIDVGEVCASDC